MHMSLDASTTRIRRRLVVLCEQHFFSSIPLSVPSLHHLWRYLFENVIRLLEHFQRNRRYFWDDGPKRCAHYKYRAKTAERRTPSLSSLNVRIILPTATQRQHKETCFDMNVPSRARLQSPCLQCSEIRIQGLESRVQDLWFRGQG